MRLVRPVIAALALWLWVVPADFSGRWRWQSTAGGGNLDYDATFDQTFQMVSGTLQASGRRAEITSARVRGETVSFTLLTERDGRTVRQEFSGRLEGDAIEGRAVTEGVQMQWHAARTVRGKMNIDAANNPPFGN